MVRHHVIAAPMAVIPQCVGGQCDTGQSQPMRGDTRTATSATPPNPAMARLSAESSGVGALRRMPITNSGTAKTAIYHRIPAISLKNTTIEPPRIAARTVHSRPNAAPAK